MVQESLQKLKEFHEGFRPSPWAVKLVELRKSWFGIGVLYDRFVNEYVQKSHSRHLKPGYNLLSAYALDMNVLSKWHESLVKHKLIQSMEDISKLGQDELAKSRYLHLISEGSVPQYEQFKTGNNYKIWHTWTVPHPQYVSLFYRYMTIAVVTATIVSCTFRYGHHIPLRKKLDDYYNTLYTEHPEYWPARIRSKQ